MRLECSHPATAARSDPEHRVLKDGMAWAATAYGLARFAFGLKAFLRELLSLEAAEEIVRQRLRTRDAALLALVERAIFANPRSPYLKLFRAAGCEVGDVRSLVSREGVEGTLERLLEAGIYVSFEEFKGRAPAVRGSQTFTFQDTDFDNPLIREHYRSTSGGTRGGPTRILIDLEHLAQRAPHWALFFAAHDLLTSPHIFLTASYPGSVTRPLICAKFGNRFVKWFSTGSGGTLMYRIVSDCVHALARRAAGFPRAEPVSLSELWTVGEHLAGMVREGGRPCVSTSPSTAVRLCLAVQERGLSLSNVTFLLGGEPLTEARRATIEATQAGAVATYGFSEGGTVGHQCPSPTAADDVHVMGDAYAVIQQPRREAETVCGSPLLLTALLPACSKIMLNAQNGDYASLTQRRCDCLFDEVGYDQHIHTIRSSQKLTGYGVTFLAADLYHLMEDLLPKKFGGTLADYQLVEEQDGRGLPRYTLLVDPRVGPIEEGKLIEAFFGELSTLRRPYRVMVNQWAQADLLRVKRDRPLTTARGKLLPFRALGAG